MRKLPTLLPLSPRRAESSSSVVFAVYAAMGTDPVLSRFPGNVKRSIKQQPLVQHLLKVAAQGVNVAALVDLFDDDTWLVEIPAGQPGQAQICSAWKQNMAAPQALAGFLRRVTARFPTSTLVLALEGHGAGYLPDIDGSRITPQSTGSAGAKKVEWRIGEQGAEPFDDNGAPLLGISVFPELPCESPEALPVALPMSTWALGEALRSAVAAKVPRPAVIHFNNCFNMSVEVLATVARYADYATGYANYNFFTAGQSYPWVFQQLKNVGSASRAQLATWFALGNQGVLKPKRNHPTVGASIALARMGGVRKALDSLSIALVLALRQTDGHPLPDARKRIEAAVTAAQKYDTQQGYELAVPDQLTDLGSLAAQLHDGFPAGHPVNTAATALAGQLAGVWQYGDRDRPRVDEDKIWDFRNPRLGMNILLPDPAITGDWDWRSPYYLSGKVDPNKPPAQRHIIDFLTDPPSGKNQPWIEFIKAYHDVPNPPRIRLLRAMVPQFPDFDIDYKPRYPLLPDEPFTGAPGIAGNPSTGPR